MIVNSIDCMSNIFCNFEPRKIMSLQILSQKFYKKVVPRLLKKVPTLTSLSSLIETTISPWVQNKKSLYEFTNLKHLNILQLSS